MCCYWTLVWKLFSTDSLPKLWKFDSFLAFLFFPREHLRTRLGLGGIQRVPCHQSHLDEKISPMSWRINRDFSAAVCRGFRWSKKRSRMWSSVLLTCLDELWPTDRRHAGRIQLALGMRKMNSRSENDGSILKSFSFCAKLIHFIIFPMKIFNECIKNNTLQITVMRKTQVSTENIFVSFGCFLLTSA